MNISFEKLKSVGNLSSIIQSSQKNKKMLDPTTIVKCLRKIGKVKCSSHKSKLDYNIVFWNGSK